ncbi:FtsX-like permease family protein [Cellulomonas sp. P24]|uniref:ABC transporter permease n=1 Tax=Cellulomonas sp. P24 TaxID=2885206 RepID=UPI00216ADC9B|nr:ABC transporter permease [Cellulomonas sp. P24]MCR6493257.1 ABC transporter permease [Cellulomonas sp. P24]
MFLAWRELRFARSRFTLMGGVVALIAVLVVLLSGLSTGLVNDGVSGLQRLPVTAFAFAGGTKTDSAFSRSIIDLSQVTAWRTRPGVADAAPFGNQLVNGKTNAGLPVDLALFGVEPDSFLAPKVATGAALGTTADGIVISSTLKAAGLAIGDVVTLDRIGTRLTVIGVLPNQHTFGHVDVAYVPLRTWQQVHAGAGPGDTARPQAYQEATAVALRASPGRTIDLAAGDAAAGTTSMTRDASFAASPGYTAETSTLDLIQVFLYAISALVVGAFFTVWTIQRSHELAVMRAMGASTRYLLRDGLSQAFVVLLASTLVGVGIGVAGGGLLSGTSMPFALAAPDITLGAALLVVLGMVGATAAVVRVTRIDPLAALGGQR